MPGRVPKERDQYFIRLEKGEVHEVNREVYLCWYAGERQERYQIERDRKHGVISLSGLSDLFCDDGNFWGDVIASPEDGVDVQIAKKVITEALCLAIQKLQPDEKELISALFFEDVSLRSYARKQGVTHRAIQKRRDMILRNLRTEMEQRGFDCDSILGIV